MPVPSPETEEWRYTDLREFDLSTFRPYKEEPAAETLDEVKPDVLAYTGHIGERAGLSIQHNSTSVIAHISLREQSKCEKAEQRTIRKRRDVEHGFNQRFLI